MTLGHFGGTFGGNSLTIINELMMKRMMRILQRTGTTVFFISIQKITFEALLCHFYGTFWGLLV